MRTWLLQSNPTWLDLDGYLTSGLERIQHGVKRYPHLIEPGDRVYLWRAKGRSRLTPGIVAQATVVETPEFRGQDRPEFFNAPDRPKLRVVLSLEEVRLTPADGMIRREDVKRLPEMMRHPIVTSNTGTDFALSEEQAKELDDLWRAQRDRSVQI
jgi:hypothetical protein